MSGIAPERDFATGARPVLFDTDIEEFQYATHGGTAYVVMAVSKLPTRGHRATLFYGREPRSTWATNLRLSQELAARRFQSQPTIACAA